jgi:hypothetical protein
MFVGSVIAGLPLLAGRTGLLAQGLAATHEHDAIAAVDPVIDQIVRQIALIHNAAQGGVRGAHARALALQLRMLSTYGRQVDMDDRGRTALREIVEREGRNTVLYAEPDVETRTRIMRQYGFRPDDRSRDMPLTVTHADREAALDAVLANGITPACERLAAALDTVAARLDRRNRGLVALGQDDWQIGYCTELYNQFQQAQLYAIPWCLTAKYFAWAAPTCVALEGGASVLLLAYLIQC